MLYGYLKENKVVYAGRKADGIWKGSKGYKRRHKTNNRKGLLRCFRKREERIKRNNNTV